MNATVSDQRVEVDAFSAGGLFPEDEQDSMTFDWEDDFNRSPRSAPARREALLGEFADTFPEILSVGAASVFLKCELCL